MKEIIKILNEFADSNEKYANRPVIFKSDFPAIAERIAELDKWVSVETELPELDKEVLLYDDWRKKEGKEGDIRTGYLSEFTTRKTSEGEKKYCEWGGTEFAFNITHWQPLPSPPNPNL